MFVVWSDRASEAKSGVSATSWNGTCVVCAPACAAWFMSTRREHCPRRQEVLGQVHASVCGPSALSHRRRQHS